MMRVKRSEQIGDLIRAEIAEIILRELKDPRIGFVTVTKVTVSDDLRTATIYYSVFGDENEKKDSALGLESAKGFIKRQLGKRVSLKYMPEMTFRFDDSFEYASSIDALLQSVKQPDDVER